MALTLVQLRRDDLAQGLPLPFAVYDNESRLVLAEGQVIDSAARADELFLKGAYRASANEERPDADARRPHALPTGSQQCTFDDMRLQIGDALQLQGVAGRERYYVKLIGCAPGGSVLVTTPTLDGHVQLIREGQGFIARAFSGRSAFAFNTLVHRVCNVPYPYLHLQFPRVVEGVAVRREARIRLRVIASVARISLPGEPAPAVIGDLSPSGARKEARDKLADKGDALQLSFRLRFDQDDAYFVTDAIVRSLRKELRGADAAELHFMHGVEFVGMQPNERLLLRTLILQRLAEGRREEPGGR
jgi:hypothetical protein